MFDVRLSEFFESGAAVLAASVDRDAIPRATRAWGVAVAADLRSIRVLVPATADGFLAAVATTLWIATCFVDVATYRSVQVKGVVTDLPERALPSDVALWKRYTDRFAAATRAIGYVPSEKTVLLMQPDAVVPVVFEVREVFDQTPGPRAGVPIVMSPPP